MALSTPTGLLVLAMLIGQAAGFAEVPTGAVEKGGDLLPSRMSYNTGGNACAGKDNADWVDEYGDGCDWYAVHDPGCSYYTDYGQMTNCPQSCNLKCFCPPGQVLLSPELLPDNARASRLFSYYGIVCKPFQHALMIMNGY